MQRTRLNRAVVIMSAFGAAAAGLGLISVGRVETDSTLLAIGLLGWAISGWCLWQLWSGRLHPVAVMIVIAASTGALGTTTDLEFGLSAAAILVLYAAVGAVIIPDTSRFWAFVLFVGGSGGFYLLAFWSDWLPVLDNRAVNSLLIEGVVFWASAWIFRKVRDEIVTQDQHIRSKDAFLARVGHELRTPLTSVLGYSTLLTETESLPADVRQQATVIAAEANRIAEVVDDFTVVARIDDDILHMNPTMTAVAPLVHTVLGGLAPVGVDVRVTGDADVSVYADTHRLRQMLRALITNGLRHAHSKIEIAVKVAEEGVSIEVIDDGPGLSTENLEEFSEPYHHAHAEPGQPQRLGLGLNVALHLAKAMNASLTYRRSGISTFKVTFPQPHPISPIPDTFPRQRDTSPRQVVTAEAASDLGPA